MIQFVQYAKVIGKQLEDISSTFLVKYAIQYFAKISIKSLLNLGAKSIGKIDSKNLNFNLRLGFRQ